jgi:hypothetical protein
MHRCAMRQSMRSRPCVMQRRVCHQPSPFLHAPAEVEVLLVAPQHRGACLDGRLGQHVVQVDDLVPPAVADDDEHAALAQLDAVLHQRADPGVDLFAHGARHLGGACARRRGVREVGVGTGCAAPRRHPPPTPLGPNTFQFPTFDPANRWAAAREGGARPSTNCAARADNQKPSLHSPSRHWPCASMSSCMRVKTCDARAVPGRQ